MRLGFKIIPIVSLWLLGTGVNMADAQPNAAYKDFTGLADATPVQIQLTYVAALQDEAVSPVIYVVTGQTAKPAAFVPFQRPGIVYTPQNVGRTVRTVTAAQMTQIIDAAGKVSAVVNSTVAANYWLSFAMLNTQTNKAAEAVLDQPQTLALVQAIGDVLKTANASAFGALTELACVVGAQGAEVPKDVTTSVGLQLTGLRLNRATGKFVGLLTVTNKSGSALPGPISIGVLFSEANLSLSNKTGNTCATTPPGIEYINVGSGGSLAAGASIEVGVEIANPELNKVVPTYKVLAGVGAR